MKKTGILGGGQLGKMLLQAAANYPVETHVLENDPAAPAAHLCHYFTKGDITDFEAVYQFGKDLDIITIEIENVNIEALEKLESEGKTVIPKPAVLKTIKNKVLQKEFYSDHQIPTAAFVTTTGKSEIAGYLHLLPAVHKLAESGYDGKGVQVIEKAADIDKGFEAPAVLEKKINIHKEIAQMIAIGMNGEIRLYPPVEMVFDQYLNLLDYQICPADLEKRILWKIEAIALTTAKKFNSAGLFAVEMLIDKEGEVFVNETAPRVHNSGHHTIESVYCNQFDMLWRILLNYPLGNTGLILPSLMVNLVGSNGSSGTPVYEGLEEVLKIENAFVHLYGKMQTKPGRKMGHVTVLSNERQELIHQANRIKNTIKITGTG
jgi:5-(carboxyamino)imidazole ribonucleotide synthase